MRIIIIPVICPTAGHRVFLWTRGHGLGKQCNRECVLTLTIALLFRLCRFPHDTLWRYSCILYDLSKQVVIFSFVEINPLNINKNLTFNIVLKMKARPYSRQSVRTKRRKYERTHLKPSHVSLTRYHTLPSHTRSPAQHRVNTDWTHTNSPRILNHSIVCLHKFVLNKI